MRGQMRLLWFIKHWVALTVSCWSNSSSTVWMVNHWYTQVGKGEQSCKKSIIVSLISPHQKEAWFTPGQRDQERMCLQITASAGQPPKARSQHTHTYIHTNWCDYATANSPRPTHNNQKAESLTPQGNYQQFVLSCRLLGRRLLICWLFRMQGPFKDGPDDGMISQVHDKVACSDYINTHK